MLDREEQEELEAAKQKKKDDCGDNTDSRPRVTKVQKMIDAYKSPI